MSETSRRTFIRWSSALAVGAFAAPLLSSALANAAPGTAPALDALTSDWLAPSALRHLPAISNFWGGVNVSQNVLGFTNFTLPPYAQGGSSCDLTVDGAGLTTTSSRWSAYEILRKATTAKRLTVQTATRLAFEANQLLLQVTVSNPTAAQVTTTLSANLNPRIRKRTSGWSWGVPRPGDNNFTGQTVGTPAANVMVSDKSSPAVTVFAVSPAATLTASGSSGTASWDLTLAAGATKTLTIVMAVGDTSTGQALVAVSDGQSVVNAANATLEKFTSVFTAAATGWSTRWTQAFTSKNTHFSGSLPVLTPEDTATGNAIARLYYMSVLSVLAMERTNLGPAFNTALGRTGTFSGLDRVYVTAAPEYAPTVTYFWDTSYASVILSLLDPTVLRTITKTWMSKDIYGCYAVEWIQGGTVGPWYSANDLTVFSTTLNYLNYSGDLAYLQESVNSKTVLQRLTDNSTHWKSLVPTGGKLADYGENHNLLEVLPKYTNQVASFNAANVWMMNQAAAWQEAAGDTTTATSLRSSADTLLPEVLALYAPGEGVWNCRHADGSLVAVRTVLDFAIGANLLADKLTSTQKSEMKKFVTDELLDGDWMRALSLRDSQAPVDRVDHGTSGAYDSWPALTSQTFARFGDYASLLNQFTKFSNVTSKGPFSQAHQLTYPSTSVSAPDRASLNPAQALTVSAWVNASSWPTEIWRGSIIAKDTWAQGNGGYVLRGGAGGRLSFAITVGGNWADVQTTATVPTSGWHHVAGVYDGATMKIYIDGVEQATRSQTGSLTASSTPVVIGNCPSDGTRKFVGSIDEPRVHKRALSAAEITAAYQGTTATAGTQDPALVLRVPTNSGTVVTTADSAKLNPEQTLTISAWVNATSWPKTSWRSIIAKDTEDQGGKGYALRGRAGGRISFGIAVGGTWTNLETTATVPTGGWHHVTGVYDGAAMKIYIDGVERASRTLTGALTPSTGVAVLVGGTSKGGDDTRKFVGTINEARVYDRALTAAEVTSKYSGGVANESFADPAMTLRLPFDEGTGSSTTEATTGTAIPTGAATTWSTGKTGFGKALVFGAASTVPAVGVPAELVMTYNEICGGKFADVIISDLFGYTPNGSTTALQDATMSRGFNGTLSGVMFKGVSHTITSSSTTGLSITAE
ncbi:LamG domain-containing protein [Streptomyces sp. NPDC057582]|uniref:LamG domain-containing protein n=1 Tax=Streptomyces sp. NPDC057582 TaxID=3346174 RepID=UPI003699744F